MMEGGGNVTINGLEYGHGRKGGGRHNNYFEAQASECDEVTRGEVNVTINLLRPRFDSIGNQDDARRRNMTIKWIEGG
jgi:hypothetical protein